MRVFTVGVSIFCHFSCILGILDTVVHIDEYNDIERLLYCDEDIIVYDKPPNFPSVPGVYDKDSIVSRAAITFNIDRIDRMIVHRLDYATSGVLVMARNIEALKALHTQLRRKQTRKIYKAIVARTGDKKRFTSLSGEIALPIVRDPDCGPPFHCCRDPDGQGKPSLTVWRAEEVVTSDDEKQPTMAMLSLEPRTGRTHQLRVHAAAVGMPILGDSFYAPPAIIEKAPRLLLHASEISLLHPFTGRAMTFRAKCPFRIL